MNNRTFAQQDKDFIAACERAGIPATQRQASKFRNKQGRAWEFRNGATVSTGNSPIDKPSQNPITVDS